MTRLGAPFEQILDSYTQTTHPVTTILTDISLSWAVHAGAHRNIPVAGLWTTTMTEFSMHCHKNLFEEKQFPTDLEEHANDVVDFIPGISPPTTTSTTFFTNPPPTAIAYNTNNPSMEGIDPSDHLKEVPPQPTTTLTTFFTNPLPTAIAHNINNPLMEGIDPSDHLKEMSSPSLSPQKGRPKPPHRRK
ncbi:hypothetical protein LWI28_001978 [Acer negundo]|uniref:Uncharacterized protein n=1 Tax=Acer negundo TaxID=4023 RepID=A0AAD5J3J6_ACENE|nr:hypothetical protein LWI28_001978 [Acer negundo]